MQKIKNLRELSLDDSSEIGQKAAYLGQLSKGFNVAPGYVLSKEVFDGFIEHNQLKSRIRNLMAIADIEDEQRLQDVSNEIMKLIISSSFDTETKDKIIEAYYSLNIKDDVALSELVENESDPIVVVRSSPLDIEAEGSLVNLIYVRGKEKLLRAINACFASLFTVDAIKKRMSENRSKVGIAVIIQKMIMPNVSGNISMEGQDFIVKASYGLFDKSTKFDRFVVSDELNIKTISVEKQKTAFMNDIDEDKLSMVELSSVKGENQKLTDKQALALARLFKKTGMNKTTIEFILDKENYYFIQATKTAKHIKPEKETEDNKETEKETESQKEQYSKQDEEGIMVDLQNSNKGINKEAEDKAKTQEKKEENTLFSLFNANKGSEIPNISASPSVKRDNPVKVAQSMAAPEKKDFFIKKRSEYEINEKNDNSRAGSFSVNHHEKSQFQEEDSGVEIISEAQTDDISEDKTDDNEKEASKSTEIFQQEEEKRGSESISIEKTPSNPSEIEKQELRKKEFRQPHKESGNDKELHPLNNEEWFQTLKMEHTKMLLSYDVVILNTLKNKYTEYFADMPINFDEMIDKLKTRVSVPYAEEIKKIRHERDQFLHYHKTVSMEELKNAYETTVLFLREFS